MDTTTNSDVINTLDMDKWNDEYAVLHRIIIGSGSTQIGQLQGKATDLRNYADEVYNAVLKDLALVRGSDAVAVKSATYSDEYEKWLKVANQNPSDEDAQKRVDRYKKCFVEGTTDFNKKLVHLVKNIKDNTDILKVNTREDLKATGFYAQLNDGCKLYSNMIANYSQMLLDAFVIPIRELEDEIKAYDAKISEKTDPEKILADFKKLLPSTDELSDLITKGSSSQESADLEAIKLVYSTAISAIDKIGEAFTLCGDFEKRRELQKKHDDLLEQYTTCQKGLDELVDVQTNLLAMVSLHSPLLFFAENGAAVADCIESHRKELWGFVASVDMACYIKALQAFVGDGT